MKKKHYSPEFKQKLLAAVRNGKSHIAVAKTNKIPYQTLSNWINRSMPAIPAPALPETSALQEENKRLRNMLATALLKLALGELS